MLFVCSESVKPSKKGNIGDNIKICTFCDSRMVVSVLLGGSNTVEIRAQIIVHYNEVYNSVPSLAPSLPQDSYLQTCLLSRGNDTTEQVQLLMKQFAVSL